MSKRHIVIAGLISLGLSACSQQPQPEPAPVSPVAEPAPAPELPTKPFAQDTLYSLLVAEFAGRRGNPDIALDNYLEQAQQTRDIGLAKHSTQIARQLRKDKAGLEAALLWSQLDPSSEEALFIATTELINARRYVEALEYSRKLELRGNQALHLTVASQASNSEGAQIGIMAEQLQMWLDEDGDDKELLTALAILLQQQAPEESMALAKRALAIDPSYISAAMVEVKSLQRLNQLDLAQKRLAELLEQQPNNKRLRVQYARLMANIDLPSSEQEFAALHKDYPKDTELQLAYALVLYEQRKTDAAEEQFSLLLDYEQSYSMANYYLGRISMNRQQPHVAMGYFDEVQPGDPNFLPAWVFRSDILIEQGQSQAAIALLQSSARQFPKLAQRFLLVTVESLNKYGQSDLSVEMLNQALERDPQNRHLLYGRAMSFEKQDNIAAMEADLRAILENKPDNASVLNALGYTLATRSDRKEEAFELISKAFKLNPKDPAIIDSMGWIEYLRGNLQSALGFLRQAMNAYPDHEIAAHLGEVLWQLGRAEEAQSIWQQGFELHPGSEILQETIQRLNAKIPQP
ncbi:tetratricopeptide repeat protein [uncultured Pseudoteredinibacter sp.]|uniref:tetratricopeptide repeat protein n=1 Tax=uncultured Pseudoteredinibacter sp. TaxID=1641701 RepID=UPI002637E54C|nr:tetratricopeptide repeat protein [uncultured Pseudoteredinibacter sp.]